MKLPFFKKKQETIPGTAFNVETIKATDIIAPSSLEITQHYLKIGDRTAKTFFIFSYPRYLSSAWLSPIINLDTPMDVSFFVFPIDSGTILKQLRRRVTEVQAELAERQEKGLIRDPALETAFQDIETLRGRLQTAQERMFRFGLYLTLYADNEQEIKSIETELRSILESRLIYLKPALYQQRQGFISSSPYGTDQLQVYTTLNTEPLSSAFPFISFDLSSNEGILYGINLHNSSLVLFDRFSLENANLIVFAKSGSGKSFAIKLEVLRLLMVELEVIILDPENEYKPLAESVDGSFFNISLASPHHLNPFDLPLPKQDELVKDVLRSNIINLVGLLRIMLGGLTPEEDAIMDRALTETYAAKDITAETDPGLWDKNVPLMSDLEAVLQGMEGTDALVRRLRKFTKGTYADFFNQKTNISTDKQLVVFGIRDVEDELRPMAMFTIMRHIWNKVKSEFKKRVLVVDEAWWLMRNEDSASFLFGLCKRGRKYGLGVTTITQDVGDFMRSAYGQPIITNSSLQFLMKQSPATIKVVKETFNLTEREKNLLLEVGVGEGLFFAGQKHVAIKAIASPSEHKIITGKDV
ncbi:MAG: ATP-binding protein [Candidatus Nealsonbacteria bacterium]|nr:ATP-binding protein [Candidatus Nealsonbacteria bacterium]